MLHCRDEAVEALYRPAVRCDAGAKPPVKETHIHTRRVRRDATSCERSSQEEGEARGARTTSPRRVREARACAHARSHCNRVVAAAVVRHTLLCVPQPSEKNDREICFSAMCVLYTLCARRRPHPPQKILISDIEYPMTHTERSRGPPHSRSGPHQLLRVGDIVTGRVRRGDGAAEVAH